MTTEPAEHELPCKFETFSGVCMICGADIGEECEVEREWNGAMRRAVARVATAIACDRPPTMSEVSNVIQWRKKVRAACDISQSPSCQMTIDVIAKLCADPHISEDFKCGLRVALGVLKEMQEFCRRLDASASC